jgi:hypothetical protein
VDPESGVMRMMPVVWQLTLKVLDSAAARAAQETHQALKADPHVEEVVYTQPTPTGVTLMVTFREGARHPLNPSLKNLDKLYRAPVARRSWHERLFDETISD